VAEYGHSFRLIQQKVQEVALTQVWISKESSTELKKNRKISAETSERMGSAVLILCSFVDEMDIYLLFPHTGVNITPCQFFCAPALIGLVNNL